MPLFDDLYTIAIMQGRKNFKHVITFSEQVR